MAFTIQAPQINLPKVGKATLSPNPDYIGKGIEGAKAVGGALGALLNKTKAPAPVTAQTNSNSFLGNYMGVPAKAPEQNVTPFNSTLSANQAKAQSTQATGATSLSLTDEVNKRLGIGKPPPSGATALNSLDTTPKNTEDSPFNPNYNTFQVPHTMQNEQGQFSGGTQGSSTPLAKTGQVGDNAAFSDYWDWEHGTGKYYRADGMRTMEYRTPPPGYREATTGSNPFSGGQVGTNPVGTQQPKPYTVNEGLYGQLITGLANRGLQPGEAYQQAYGDAQRYNSQLSQSMTNQAGAQAQNRLNPIPIGDQTGREAVIRAQYGQQQTALSQGFQGASNLISGANTQQSLMQQALQQAAAGAAPTQMTPGNYLQSPLGGGASSAAQGQQQGLDAATNWAIAQQNIQQGRTYQGQAQDISNGLQLLKEISPRLTKFMEEAGLNPSTVPWLNTKINQIDGQANTVAYRSMNELLGMSTSLIQQMLQAQGNMTPTDAGDLVKSYELGNLTPTQLGILLHNMEVTGNLRLSQAQSASHAGYGANSQVGTPAQGADAQYGQLDSGGANQLNDLPDWLKVVAGVGLGAARVAGDIVQNATGTAAAGAVGGVAGATAKRVLGF